MKRPRGITRLHRCLELGDAPAIALTHASTRSNTLAWFLERSSAGRFRGIACPIGRLGRLRSRGIATQTVQVVVQTAAKDSTGLTLIVRPLFRGSLCGKLVA